MKRVSLLLSVLLCSFGAIAQPGPAAFPHDILYYLPEGNYTFDPNIPQPKDVLGFEIGEQHADWNNVLMYMEALDRASDRVSIYRFGQTNQFRPFIQVTITSADNQKRLEDIRREHLQLTDTEQSDKLNIDRMPLIANLMYSIHGNEPSGVNSSLVLAYYLTALQGADADRLRNDMVVILTPGQNPDGINRFASWVNSSRSFPDVADLNSREFTEPWPSSRTNHYWADTNRDWLMAQHPEGQNALEMYYQWMPNVVCDFHEQGGDRSYYFSPGHPKRTHHLTSPLNQTLTAKLTSSSARELDQIGTLYFSKEGYDDYYIGKGAAYGDIHGSVCILYEQLASRGHLRPTKNYGIMSFASTVRNQAFSAVGLLKGALGMKTELMNYQRDYYKNSRKDAAKDPVKGYIFNARGDRAVTYHFLDNLRRHRLDVYRLAASRTVGGHSYQTDDSYIIPTGQKYYAMVRTLMEDATHFEDSTFYDISTWTFPYAYNLQYDELSSVSGLLGERVGQLTFPTGEVVGVKSSVAYLFENTQYYAPRMATELLRRGLIVKVSGRPFTYSPTEGKPITLTYGTFIVPAQGQPITPDEVYALVGRLSRECGITTYAASSGLMSDYDLGSTATKPLDMPRVALIVGRGMGIPSSGEAWMLLDKRFQLPPTLIEYSKLNSVDLNSYNVLIMSDGIPTTAVSARVNDKLKAWTEDGGTLIAIGSAYRWTNSAKITDFKTIPSVTADKTDSDAKKKAPAPYRSYASRSEATGNAVDGVILNCRLDPTHPLGWGYNQETLPVIRNAATAFHRPEGAYSTPLSYLDKPYLSGFISNKNLSRMAGTPAAMIESAGKGRVILLVDDPNFRMYWYGGTRLFMNAILFGQLL
ncbi:MAG: peptidase M14 [Prevotellaceae bacterium]|jgi:hypothetical protein|nr:peptidase M14 [Prevotellaceae bacterium]